MKLNLDKCTKVIFKKTSQVKPINIEELNKWYLVWFIFFVINFRDLFNAKGIFVENYQWYYLSYCGGYKKVYTFPKSINSKVNVIVHLEFEFAYFEAVVQHVSHCAMGISQNKWYWSFHHHHQVALLVQISLTLSRHSSLSTIAPGRFSRLHPVSVDKFLLVG